jgi:NADPH:quinone reductase-like Zn-dependent oxidoreductase
VGDWIRAHCKRFLGIDTFPKGRMLFWVRFPNSAEWLQRLRSFYEDGKLRVHIAGTFPLTSAGVGAAFRSQMERRVVGKSTIKCLAEEEPVAGAGGSK